MRTRLLLLCFLSLGSMARLGGQADEGIFTPAAEPATTRPPEAAVIRRRPVTIRLDAVRAAAGPGGAGAPAQTLILNLFDDVRLTATLLRLETTSTGYVWVGRVAGVDGATVTLAVTGSAMSGSVFTPEATYAIRPSDGAVHDVQQVNPSALPQELPPVVVPNPPPGPAALVTPVADDGSIVDLLVVYTPAARVAQGGAAGIQALIDLGVSETNQAYENSGAIQRIRLVHKEEIAYTEAASMSTDLSRLAGTADGFMDGVHALRNTHGADLVQLIANSPTPCGIAYLMTNVSTAFASLAFGVTDDSCVSPNYSFAHEMGHNMGLHHDVYVTGSATGAYPYSRGYVNQAAFAPGAPVSARWRDIMAYNDQCAASGFTCTRLLYFSNPLNTYNGHPMGDAATADGVRTLNQTRFAVANFRESISTPTTTLSIGDTFVVEGNSGVTAASFRVTLSSASSSAVTVSYATANGTATSGVDYSAVAGTLNIPAGTTEASIQVNVLGDSTPESTEQFTVNLSSPGGATLDDSTATGIIRNDDFTDATLSGALVKAVHVVELRTMIDEVRTRRGVGPYAYSRTVAAGVVIGAIDIVELRAALPVDCRPAFTDPVITPGVTPIRAVHITQLRSAAVGCP